MKWPKILNQRKQNCRKGWPKRLKRLVTAYEASHPVDLLVVLKHELLPVPISLAEMNGTLRTGNKSVLVNKLTEDIDCPEAIELPDMSSCLIIRWTGTGGCLRKARQSSNIWDMADTFVRAVLKAGCSYKRIDVVFDRYREETIKGATRTRCTKAAQPIRRLVEGCDVPLPKNWINFLSLPDNKACQSTLWRTMCSGTRW